MQINQIVHHPRHGRGKVVYAEKCEDVGQGAVLYTGGWKVLVKFDKGSVLKCYASALTNNHQPVSLC